MARKEERKTITGDASLLAYRLRTGCPKCKSKLVNRVRWLSTSTGDTKYGGDYYACPNECRSPVSNTRYTIGHPNSKGKVSEPDMGTGDWRREYSGPRTAVVKRTADGEKVIRSR